MSQTQEVRGTATTIYTDTGRDGNRIQVWYHKTCVVEFDHNMTKLHSGGYRSATTKLRMNQSSNQFGLGYQVFQKSYAWFVELPSGETVDFMDGMEFARS